MNRKNGGVVTGQPTDKHEGDMEKAWDDRTKALAACLEALLEVHRARNRTAAANDADRSSSPGKPPRQR